MSTLSPRVRVLVVSLTVLAAVVISIGVGGGAWPVMALAVAVMARSQHELVGAIPGRERAPLRHALTQTWWAPVAGLLALLTLAGALRNVMVAQNASGRIVGTVLLVAFGVGMLYGLARRPFSRAPGNTLVLFSTTPALLLFWLVFPTLLAIIVWVGVLTSGFDDSPAVATAS